MARVSSLTADPAADSAALLRRLGFAILMLAVPVSALFARRAIVVLVPVGIILLVIAAALDGGHRPSRSALDTAVDASRERHDPQAAGDAVDAAVEQRTVRFRPARDGMTSMWASLPSGDAEKLRRRTDSAARAASESGHPRTRDQLRADALCALGDPTTNDIGTSLYDAEESAGACNATTGTRADAADRPSTNSRIWLSSIVSGGSTRTTLSPAATVKIPLVRR